MLAQSRIARAIVNLLDLVLHRGRQFNTSTLVLRVVDVTRICRLRLIEGF